MMVKRLETNERITKGCQLANTSCNSVVGCCCWLLLFLCACCRNGYWLFCVDPIRQGWINETDNKHGRYSISWVTGGSESVDLLHYALPHHQVCVCERVCACVCLLCVFVCVFVCVLFRPLAPHTSQTFVRHLYLSLFFITNHLVCVLVLSCVLACVYLIYHHATHIKYFSTQTYSCMACTVCVLCVACSRVFSRVFSRVCCIPFILHAANVNCFFHSNLFATSVKTNYRSMIHSGEIFRIMALVGAFVSKTFRTGPVHSALLYRN